MCAMRRYIFVFLQFFIICIFLLAGAAEYSWSQDSYEPDDTYLQANIIVPNYVDAQIHTLHDTGDVDWVKFYALAGQSYMIMPSWDFEGYFVLYGPDGKTYVDNAKGETLYWACPDDGEGVYYVEIFDNSANPGVIDYSIQVRTYFGFGLPVYLTGQINNNCNQPVPNARIKVSGASDTNSGMSSTGGAFLVSLKFEGTYTVTFYADNHQTLVRNLNVPGNTAVQMTRMNNPPVVQDDFVRCPVKGSVSGNVLNNDSDSDGDSLVAVLDSNVRNGRLVLHSTGAFSYTHNGGSSTTDSFTYHVSDGCTTSATARVNITIHPASTSLPFLMLLLQ